MIGACKYPSIVNEKARLAGPFREKFYWGAYVCAAAAWMKSAARCAWDAAVKTARVS